MAFLTRDQIVKTGVVVICLAFLFELFAFGGRSDVTTPVNNQTNQSSLPVTGVAIAEGTVSSYGTEIFLAGADADARAVISSLEASGAVQYSAPGPGGLLVLNLARKVNASDVAGQFQGTNATLTARARLRMPTTLNFTTNNGSVSAAFQDISIDLDPSMAVGTNVSVRVTASILGGEVITYIAVPVSLAVSFSANATVAGYTPEHALLVTVPWQNRLFDDAALRGKFMQAYPDGTSVIDRNFSVLVDLGGANFSQPYVIAQEPGMLVINGSFADSARIGADLLAAGVSALPVFPSTRMLFVFNDTAEALNLSFISDAVNYSLIEDYRNARLMLPATVEVGNRTLEVDGRNVSAQINSNSLPVGSQTELAFTGELFAGRISNVVLAQPA
ncbi:Uncharacterised protein [Candidatus Burarchaeum australiense]|nr:Uncharacterised protein [Candidatus Burarchaeum australiense]